MPLENCSEKAPGLGDERGVRFLSTFDLYMGEISWGLGPAAAPDAAAVFDKRHWEFSSTLLTESSWKGNGKKNTSWNRSAALQDKNPGHGGSLQSSSSGSRTLEQSGLSRHGPISCMLRTADPSSPWNKDTQGRDLTRNTAVRPNNPNERNTSNLFQEHLTCPKLTWPHPGWPLTAVGTVQYGLQLFSTELYLIAGVKMWRGAKLQEHDDCCQPVRASTWRQHASNTTLQKEYQIEVNLNI